MKFDFGFSHSFSDPAMFVAFVKDFEALAARYHFTGAPEAKPNYLIGRASETDNTVSVPAATPSTESAAFASHEASPPAPREQHGAAPADSVEPPKKRRGRPRNSDVKAEAPAAPAAPPATPSAVEVPAEPVKGGATLDEIQKIFPLFARPVEAGGLGREGVKDLLLKFGLDRLRDVKPEQYGAVYQHMRGALDEKSA